MAGFLRKKSRQEPSPKPISSPSSPSSKPVTPLFARFATTTAQQPNDAQRVVSSPMLLSGKKENGAGPPVSRSSGTRSASVVPARESDVNRRRSQISHPHSAQNPNGTPTMQPRQSLSKELRPGSHLNLEKPLPPPTPYNHDPSPSVPPQDIAPINRRMSAAVSSPPTTYQAQHNQLRSRTPSVRDVRLPPSPQSQPRQGNLRQADPPVGQSQFLNNGVPFHAQQPQLAPTRSGTLPPPITNHKPQPHLPSYRTPASEGHSAARDFAPQQSQSIQNLQRETQPHSLLSKLPSARASFDRFPEQHRNTRSPDLPAPPVPQDTVQVESDLPPEFALFQKFSSPLPSPSISARQILPDTKPTGQDPASSAERSTVKSEKSTPEIRSIHPVNGSAPLPQAPSNIMGINASHLPNQPFISPSEKQPNGHSRSISPPRRLPVPPTTKPMQTFSAKDEKFEQLAPTPISTVDYRSSRTPESPSSDPPLKSPMNGVRPLPPSPPQSPLRTPPPLIKGRPLIFNPPPLVAPPPPAPKVKTWDPEWDDPPESEPEPEPAHAYPSPAPTIPATPRSEVVWTRGGEDNRVPLSNGHFVVRAPAQSNLTGMPVSNIPREVLPTSGMNGNVQALRPIQSRSPPLPTLPLPQQQQQQQLPQPALQRPQQLSEKPSHLDKKLSKARSAGPGDTAAARSSHSHSHANSIAVSSPSMQPVQRIRKTSIPKSLIKTPVVPLPAPPEKLEPTGQLDELTIRNAGLPLDDDPFAKVEGVKMMPPKESKQPQLKEQEVASSVEAPNEPKVPTDETQPIVPADEDIPEITDEPKATATKPPTPDEYRQARSQRRGGPLERLPSDLLEDVVVREDRPPEPFPLILFISDPRLLSVLLSFMSFYDWCILCSISREIRVRLVQTPALREEILERFFKTVGYSRWLWNEREPLSLSLQDLNDYMRGVSTPSHEYARLAKLYVHSLSIHPQHRDPGLIDVLHGLSASTRAYTRVVLRLRAQAEKEANVQMFSHPGRNGYMSPTRGGPSRASSRAPSPTQSSFSQHGGSSSAAAIYTPAATTFRSPLFRIRRAPLLRVFVPSPEGDWLSDKSVLECEAELKRAGVVGLMRAGDVVWDMGVGDEGNVGRLVWDGSYLIDLDYTYSTMGDLPKYMPTLAFPPSYFHRVIRTSVTIGNPIMHIDITPWGEEIAANLQLMQDRVRTETPQGAIHNVVRWVYRSSFVIRPLPRGSQRAFTPPNSRSPNSRGHPSRIPIPDSDNLFVDSGWYGTIVVETEGTNEFLADLQVRCGPGAFPPRAKGVHDQVTKAQFDNRKVFRILREKSRPGEIWIRTVGLKERLM